MSVNQYETIVFFNKNVGTHNRRDCDRYMDYLHKIGKYSNALNDMISEQVAKENVELSSDIQIRSDLKADEYEKINLEDRFLYLMSERKTNFTNLFHLDNNYIPNDNEIDLMKNTWFTDIDLMDEVIFEPKKFREDFEFEYRNNYNLQRFEGNIEWLTKHSNSKAWNEFKDEFNFDEQSFKRRLTNSHDSKEFIKKMARIYGEEERQTIDDWIQDWVNDNQEYKEDYDKAISKFTNDTLSDYDKERGTKYKLAFMLFDFYNLSDPAFKSMVKENFVDTNAKYVDEIYNRLETEQTQRNELMYVGEIVDSLRQKPGFKDKDLKEALRIGEHILKFAENNLEFTDYNDKINKLSALAKQNNISFNTTPEDLIREGIIQPVEVTDIVTNIMVDELEKKKAHSKLNHQADENKYEDAKKLVADKLENEGYTPVRLNKLLKNENWTNVEDRYIILKDIVGKEEALKATKISELVENFVDNDEQGVVGMTDEDVIKTNAEIDKKIESVQKSRKNYVYDTKRLYEYLKQQFEESLKAKIEAEKEAREQAQKEAEIKEQADKEKLEALEKQAKKYGFLFIVYAPKFKHYKDIWICESQPKGDAAKPEFTGYHVAYLDLNDKVTNWHNNNIDKFNVKCAEIAQNDEIIKKMEERRNQRNVEKEEAAAKASKGMEM